MTWEYSQEIADAICEKMIAGKSILAIGKMDGFPSDDTIYRWMAKYDDFAGKCARARRIQAEQAVEQQQQIVDDCLAGAVAPDVARVALSGLQWRASKFEPKKYGDSTTVRGDESAPITTKDVTDHEGAARKLAAMMAIVANRKGQNES